MIDFDAFEHSNDEPNIYRENETLNGLWSELHFIGKVIQNVMGGVVVGVHDEKKILNQQKMFSKINVQF